jgi:hypothetical protein
VLWIRIRIRIRSDPELFEGSGSGSGSGINSFGSGSDQAQFGMNLIPNFSVKINVFSTECGKKVLCFNFILHPNVNILGIKCVFAGQLC